MNINRPRSDVRARILRERLLAIQERSAPDPHGMDLRGCCSRSRGPDFPADALAPIGDDEGI